MVTAAADLNYHGSGCWSDGIGGALSFADLLDHHRFESTLAIAMIDQFRLFLLAVRFYTRAPWHHQPFELSFEQRAVEQQRLASATRYFPIVGLLVSVLIALVYMLAAFAFAHAIAVLIGLIVGVLCTGARHEFGFAGFCEHIGRTQSSVFATIGLVLLFALKIETLAHLDSNWTPIALVTAHPFSRACAVLMMWILPCAQSEQSMQPWPATPVVRGLRRGDALFAIATGIAPTIIAAWWLEDAQSFALAALPAMIATVWMCRLCSRRLHGYDADSLGATQQIAESSFLLGLLAWATIAASYVEE